MLHLFTHIPKVGGSSFKRSVIEPNIDPEGIYKFHGLRSFALARLQNYQFVEGHYPYGIHSFTRSHCHYYTLLREPIDRAISYYYFVRQCDYSYYRHPDLPAAKALDLVEFTRLRPNIQSRMIAGYPHCLFSGMSRTLLLRLAMRNLCHNYKCFGLLENFEDFASRVSLMNGCNYRFVFGHSTVTWQRPKVDHISMAQDLALRKILRADLELYAFAKSNLNSYPVRGQVDSA